MRVLVLGATGPTGRLTLSRLLAHPGQHQVVALARTPSALDEFKQAQGEAGQRLTVLKGDLFDAPSLAPAVQGADVVIFTAGVSSLAQAYSEKTTIYTVGGGYVLDAMKEAGVKRLVAVTSQGVIDDPGFPFIYRFIVKPFFFGNMYQDMAALEELITDRAAEKGFSYTILRPTGLVDVPVGGGKKPVVGQGFQPAGCVTQVDRADLADLIVAASHDKAAYDGKTLFITA